MIRDSLDYALEFKPRWETGGGNHHPWKLAQAIQPCFPPRADIDTLCDDVKREPLEDIDMSYFSQLVPGDTLFVDISHRSFMNSDVTTFMLDVLPSIPTNVLATGFKPKKTVRDAIGEIIAAWQVGTLKNEPHFHNRKWMSKELLT